ncbi:hypothetical protein A7D25_12070 [Pseudomonas sp. 21C1]|nr:hypothetical protein A7D25_12070 [Pseudomonas sp. 21C1]
MSLASLAIFPSERYAIKRVGAAFAKRLQYSLINIRINYSKNSFLIHVQATVVRTLTYTHYLIGQLKFHGDQPINRLFLVQSRNNFTINSTPRETDFRQQKLE